MRRRVTNHGVPYNGAVVTLRAVCGTTRRESCFDAVMIGTVGAIAALMAGGGFGAAFGSLRSGCEDI